MKIVRLTTVKELHGKDYYQYRSPYKPWVTYQWYQPSGKLVRRLRVGIDWKYQPMGIHKTQEQVIKFILNRKKDKEGWYYERKKALKNGKISRQ